MSNCLVNQSNQNCAKIKELSKQFTSLQTTFNNFQNEVVSEITNLFTFRPNYTGPPLFGLYTDWNLLYADIEKVQGLRSIFFDDTDGNIIIPARADPWDMENVSWTTPICIDNIASIYTIINISDGATFNHLCIIDGLLQINYQGTVGPAMIQDPTSPPPNSSASSLLLRNGANIICSGSQPFVQILSNGFLVLMDFGAQLNLGGSSTYEIFDTSSTSGALQIIVGYISSIQNNSVRGTGNINAIKNDLTSSISTFQPNASLISYDDNVSANAMQYVPTNLADWSGIAPSSLQDALDRIAAFIATNIGPIT